MKRLLKWLMFLTIIVVASLTLILFNPRLIKSPIEHYLSQLSGYNVRLNGDFSLHISKQLSVQVKDVHIVNPERKDQPDLIVLGTLQTALETASLFSDAVILSQLQLDNVFISVDINDAGVGNWEKMPPTTPKDKSSKSGI